MFIFVFATYHTVWVELESMEVYHLLFIFTPPPLGVWVELESMEVAICSANFCVFKDEILFE